ncbi:MAG: hypothetical protein ABR581_00085 [Thermoleophilaceae bacterium]
MNTAPIAGRRPFLERWAGLGAVLYVILFIGGSILAFGGQPDSDSAPAKVASYFKDSGHRDKVGIGWALVILGIFFFLWFLSALRQLLRELDPGGFLTNLATLGGVVYATSTLTGMSLNTAVKTMSDDTYRHQVYPSLIHAADDAGYVIHSGGGVGVGALMIAASLAAANAGRIPNWACILGVLSGVLALGSIFFFPQALVAIWLLVAGVLVFRASGPRSPAAPVPPGPTPA